MTENSTRRLRDDMTPEQEAGFARWQREPIDLGSGKGQQGRLLRDCFLAGWEAAVLDTEGDRQEPATDCKPDAHVWSHQFGDDWSPEDGMLCDCRAVTWGKWRQRIAVIHRVSRADTEGDRPVTKPDSVAERGGAVDLHPSLPKSMFHQNPDGDWVCEHGTASDVHCCGCHSGFIFDRTQCTCGVA